MTIVKPYWNRSWFLYFRKFKHMKGIVIRLFGIHMVFKEKEGTEKLIKKFRLG